jgi:gluconolactonase
MDLHRREQPVDHNDSNEDGTGEEGQFIRRCADALVDTIAEEERGPSLANVFLRAAFRAMRQSNIACSDDIDDTTTILRVNDGTYAAEILLLPSTDVKPGSPLAADSFRSSGSVPSGSVSKNLFPKETSSSSSSSRPKRSKAQNYAGKCAPSPRQRNKKKMKNVKKNKNKDDGEENDKDDDNDGDKDDDSQEENKGNEHGNNDSEEEEEEKSNSNEQDNGGEDPNENDMNDDNDEGSIGAPTHASSSSSPSAHQIKANEVVLETTYRRMTHLTATLWTTLPDGMRHTGEPSAWAKMTRPGQQMHSFLEAAFFDDDKSLWLSDVPYGRVFCISPAGDWTLEHQIEGEPHAMRLAPDGSRIAVDYRHGLIALTGPDSFEVLSTGGDKPFLGLSDMTYGPDNALWFTDSGRTSLSNPTGRVYRWDGTTLRCVLDCVPYANGICISPDGAWVYVAATRANQVWKFAARLPETGTPMVGTYLQMSGGLGPDGLACNSLGWLAVGQAQAGRAYVYDSLGDLVAEVRLPRGLWTTSVTFHPDDPLHLIIVDAQYGGVFSCHLPASGH